MGKTKPVIQSFSALTVRGLKAVKKRLIEKEKKTNGYLVVAGKDGKIKKIPAKDL